MSQNKSFSRSLAIMQAISTAEQINPNAPRLDYIYKSRGKGGKTAHTTGHKHMAYVRANRKARNK